ncbi:MAG: T9SS type A sorting domain-containing protein [Ignavibacteriaceae bacterium]|nr:T9SS type A sorting domain-containing protein [Ignavibacteria bacterium]NNJ51843.1 T9SS type A sorting domain-containing protein [Ignavibacteriaceae bacterium]
MKFNFLSKITSFLFISIFILFNSTLNAQPNFAELWNDVVETNITAVGTRYIFPQSYRTLELDLQDLSTALNLAPKEELKNVKQSGFLLSLPLPDNSFSTFKIVETPVMAEELALKYPQIKTYLGQGIDDRSARVRFDITPAGFHAIIFSSKGTIYIDPYSLGEARYYISYYKKDYIPTEEQLSAVCNLFGEDSEFGDHIRNLVNDNPYVLTGPQLRTYRLACATTGEYTIFHGGTVAQGLAAVVTAINRVTGVYENEIAVRLELIPNNDLIIYTDPGSDPYTNNSGGTMLNQNQANLDAVIGNANYDIGHVFSTGGGGVAFLGVVCQPGFKARGVTGLPQPIGDPFYIDYVAHEMGHQFGGNHTFNGSAGACSGGNRNGATAYEPGSGSTIMAYAGICGSQNLQSNSDDYFHNISFVEMVNYTNNGNGNSCPLVTNTGNNEPTATVPAGGFTIPISTPFMLVGSGTDPDNDPLTYCWEEWDLGPAGHPNSPSGNAPIFRTFDPVDVPYRYFPKLANILNNSQTIGEILPTYTRTLTFRLTVRDNRAGGGGVQYAQMQSINVTNTAGPFLVTQPNTAVTWPGNTTQTVTWDVANTSIAPVNVTEVNILLSTDGGLNFTEVLASNIPNDGSEDLFLPNLPTTQARIKVEAVGNVFFDLSNENFTIEDFIPVELTAFFALVTERGVLLKWTTATEKNNSGFMIERSSNNVDFNDVVFINGKGTTTEITDYEYVDNLTKPGMYYYRLKQIDFDGSFNYSNVVETEINGPEVFNLLQNYPNPFNPSTIIKFSVPIDSRIRIELFNTLGEKVDELTNRNYSIGNHEINFDASILSNGVYYYTISANGIDGSTYYSTKKMVLIK